MIEDYLTLKKRLKDRNMEERGDLMDHRRDLEETFEPVVASNEQMALDIIKDLEPIKEDLHALNRDLVDEVKVKEERWRIGRKRKLPSTQYGPLAGAFFKRYLDPNEQTDTRFGIRYEDGKPLIGDKAINIVGDNIVIDDEVYIGTPGLWSLITDKTPTAYDEEDYERYTELLYETNVLYQHFNPLSKHPRANKSGKWNKILRPIWDGFQYEDGDSDATISEYHSANEEEKKGDGVVLYHPIKGSRIYLQKHGRCFNVRASGRRGIHLSPRPLLAGIRGDGLYLRMGSSVYNGKGLLLGPRSPFRNIPILKWIL